MELDNKKIFYAIIVIVLFVFGLYFNSIYNGYNIDDSLVLTNNQLVENGNISSIFTSYSYKSNDYNFAYRPLTILTFYIENMIFGKNPHIGHIINISLYVLLNIIIFLFLNKISEDYWSSLFITILFIAFPLHTEVVDSIKNRDELLVSIFGFLSLLFTLKATVTNKKLSYFLIFLCSLIGIFIKQSFLIFPLIIAFVAILQRSPSNFRQKMFCFTKYLTISISTLLVKWLFVYYFLNKSINLRVFEFFENPLFNTSFISRILPSIYIMGKYLILLIFPFKLSYYYGYNTVNFNQYFSVEFLLGIILIGSTIFLIKPMTRKKNTKKYLLIILGLFILLINIIAVSNLIQVLPGIIAERLIFNGVLGYCILLFYLLKYIIHTFVSFKYSKKVLMIGLMIFIIPFSFKTIARNKDWKNEFTLYSHDIRNVPNSAKANETLASNYFKKYYQNDNITYLNLSKKYFLKALKIYPILPASINNLGTINFIKKDYSTAINYYLKSIHIKNKIMTHYNLAECYKNTGDDQKAEKEYKYVLKRNPNVPNIYSSYKQLILKHNDIDNAIKFITSDLLKSKKNINNYLLLVDLYQKKNNYKAMLKNLKIANQIQPKEKYNIYIYKIESYLKNK